MSRFSRQALLLVSLLLGISVVVSEGFAIPTKRAIHGRTTKSISTTAGTSTSTSTRIGLLSPLDPRSSPSRGGATSTSTMLFAADPAESKCPVSRSMAVFGAVWGSLGVVYILLKAVTRVLPIALEPLRGSLILTPFQWGCYALSCLFFAYAEGYKGFQRKFSPLVVKRSFTLVIGTKQGSVLNYLLAPLYSMGLIHATRKRLITSWAVSLGVATLVAVVKRLPGVWRCILDAGVVVGLSYGSLSILILFVQAWRTGQAPKVDACLPIDKPSSKTQ